MSEDENLSNPTDNADETRPGEKEAMLAYMARRASQRAFYLASALESYKQAEKLDEAGLLAFLEIERSQLSRLALCGRPDVADRGGFAHDVKTIAAKFNIKPLLLAKLLRQAAAYEANQEAAPVTNNFLMAALDRENDEPEADTGAEDND